MNEGSDPEDWLLKCRRFTLQSILDPVLTQRVGKSLAEEALHCLQWLETLGGTPLSENRAVLCDRCSNSEFFQREMTLQKPDDDYPEFEIEISKDALAASALTPCHLCSLMYACVLDYELQGEVGSVQLKPEDTLTLRVGLDGYGESCKPGHLSIYVEAGQHQGGANANFEVFTHPDDVAATWISQRDLLLTVNADGAYGDIQAWLENCGQHQYCDSANNAFLPKRVLSIPLGEFDGPIRLYEPNGHRDRYAALSYCWGGDQIHKTLTGNYISRLGRLEVQNMPQTILDAIEVAQKLQIRYLWIDSLCIIQDNDADKVDQLAQMHSIYYRAYLTIVAANTDTARDGFLKTRSPQGPKISLPFIGSNNTRGSFHVRWLRDLYFPSTEPWHKRAWTFQEGLLPPRARVYASNTVQYHCQRETLWAGSSYDYSATGFPSIERMIRSQATKSELVPPRSHADLIGGHMSAPEVSQTEAQYRSSWEALVGSYTLRRMSNGGNKLVAFAAVVENFQWIWQTSQYLAGLWQHSLARDLLWGRSGDPCDCRERPRVYRAPTWSWASIDGPVSFGLGVTERETLWNFHILDFGIALESEKLAYGSARAATIILNGVLKAFVLETAPRSETSWSTHLYAAEEVAEDNVESLNEQDFSRLNARVRLDADEEPYRRLRKVWLVPIAEVMRRPFFITEPPQPQLIGIVLVKMDGSTHCSRIGAFYAMATASFKGGLRQDITVV